MYEKNRNPLWQEFRTAEPLIVLYQGKYYGMAGRFVRIRPDPNWADIEGPAGMVRPQPRDWLRKIDENGNLASVRPTLTEMPAVVISALTPP